MAAKTTTVRKDIIPYRAGVVILTPLDANKKPDYSKSVATEYDFLTSTQTSVTRESETLANGNGQDKDYTTSETYTVTVIGNTYNPIFHAVVTGRIETLPTKTLVPTEINYNLPATVPESGSLGISFGADGDFTTKPAADDDGNYNFIVEDSYGNVLVRRDTPEHGAYSYDTDTSTLEFSNDYTAALIRVIYWYEDTDSIQYASNPILQQPEYQVQIFGLSQSASTGDTYKVITTLKRATATGDVTDQMTQKSKSAPITYTFSSTPVPEGVSVYTQILTPVSSSDGSGAGGDNVVNGGDDNFTTTPGS